MRQRDGYCKVARRLPFATTVNAAQPLADVIHDVESAIVEHFERRTAARLRLTRVPARKSIPFALNHPDRNAD